MADACQFSAVTTLARELDATGLYYLRARYYNPVSQRFLTSDPIGRAGGQANFYAYAYNSPMNFSDPMGLGAGPSTPNGYGEAYSWDPLHGWKPVGPGSGGGSGTSGAGASPAAGDGVPVENTGGQTAQELAATSGGSGLMDNDGDFASGGEAPEIGMPTLSDFSGAQLAVRVRTPTPSATPTPSESKVPLSEIYYLESEGYTDEQILQMIGSGQTLPTPIGVPSPSSPVPTPSGPANPNSFRG